MLNRKTFFSYVRRAPFSGRLTQSQVDGMNAVLDYWEATRPNGDIRHLAYCMATDYHETNGKMQPVSENLNYTTAKQIKKTWPKRFKSEAEAASYVRQPEKLANKVYGNRNDLGNDYPGDGWLYRGRGAVQVTGKRQYIQLGILLGIDLVAAPELALDPQISVRALIEGMEHGIYTGLKLSDYFGPGKEEPKEARRIINGTDKAGLVEDYYFNFYGALKAAQLPEEPADVSTEEATPDKPNLARDITTIGAVIASGGTAASIGSDLLEKINNPYALGALAIVIIGLIVVFVGRYGIAKREGV